LRFSALPHSEQLKRIDARFLGLLALVVIAAAVFTRFEKNPVKKIPPVDAQSDSWPTKTFRDWAYFADPTEIPTGLANRGSRIDGVEYRGTFTSGWFVARSKVEILVAGFPRLPGNALALEIRDQEERISRCKFDRVDPRDSWMPWTVELPPTAVSFRIQAVDGESGIDGWLAVTELFEPRFRPALLPQTERAFLAFAIQAVLLIAIGLMCAQCVRWWSGAHTEIPFLPLVAAAAVALVGYLAFWIYFAHPGAGRVFSWSICISATVILFFPKSGWPRLSVNLFHPVFLAVVIGLFYVALLVLFEPPRLSFAAANRFADGLPSDNEIPRAFAERLANGQSPRALWGDWLSSDRPPLQSGWLLLTWPVLRSLGFDINTISTTGGICFQLLWVLAVWALAKNLGASPRQALAIPTALSFTGVFLLYSVFVWPKFAAAALVVAAWLFWFNARPANARICYPIGGACAALGWLSHGGVAFSLLAIVPMFLPLKSDLVYPSFLRSRRWLLALGAFAVLAVPWLAYQRFYEPPGDRLLKWHLAGSMVIDSRSFLKTVRNSYREIGLGGAWESRKQNLAL
jgi:hypothetical protein